MVRTGTRGRIHKEGERLPKQSFSDGTENEKKRKREKEKEKKKEEKEWKILVFG